MPPWVEADGHLRLAGRCVLHATGADRGTACSVQIAILLDVVQSIYRIFRERPRGGDANKMLDCLLASRYPVCHFAKFVAYGSNKNEALADRSAGALVPQRTQLEQATNRSVTEPMCRLAMRMIDAASLLLDVPK